MGLRLPLLVAALASCVLPAPGCIICDPRVTQGIQSLETEYLPGHLPREAHKSFMDKVKKMVADYKDMPIDENSYMGVIDEATQEKAVLSFLKDLKTITDSGARGELLMKEIQWMLELGKDNFARLASQFQKEGFCPNECGKMLQSLIWCDNCKKDLHLCKKNEFCGQRNVTVHETEDLVLDCGMNWHKLSKGLTNYRFFKVTHVFTENFLFMGKGSTYLKRKVTKKDEGYYTCDLGVQGHGQAMLMGFRVTVLPKRATTEPPPVDLDVPNEEFSDEVGSPQEFNVTTTTTTTVDRNVQIPTAPSSNNMLKSRLVGLLICAAVVLIAGIATAIFYFYSGKMINFIKSCLPGGRREEDDEPEVSKKTTEDLEENKNVSS